MVFRAGGGQMAWGVVGQGKCRGAAKGVPLVTGRINLSRLSWLLCTEVTRGKMKEVGKKGEARVARANRSNGRLGCGSRPS